MKRFQLGVVGASALALAGCSNLPGNNQQQGAVIGGASGAAVGAAVSHNHALGAIIGGAVGAAGGYVVGANKDKIFAKDKSGADEAARRSQESPATPDQARAAATADLNNDGFVTLDEVVAMRQAGLTDDQMLQRLRATNQVFDLTSDQQRYLLDRGVSQNVIAQMSALNQTPVVVTTPTPAPVPQVSTPTEPVIGHRP
ncbi:MAG TPA: YMGG-like glycine zipper-containing protein [Verrucomicrobiae bacterium]|nr:YMGG-like glycine zipper-containing protein [Verrucomicrobiae bacterium]